MEYRNLGRSGVKVSPICLGTAFRGAPDEDICFATIDRAIDLGINFIDCANEYQRGRCERIVGKSLKGRRDQFILTTKVCSPMGEGPNDDGLSRCHIMREVENSLSRLQTDYVDIYFAHSVDLHTPIEETLQAFDGLVRHGKVRYIGCSNFAAWQVCKALWASERHNLTSFMCVQDHYNLLDRTIERELVDLCQSEGLGIMTYSAVAVGLLTGRFRHGESPPPNTVWAADQNRFKRMMSPEADRVVETLISIGSERGKTPAQVAIAWLISRPGISSAMIGPDLPEQVDENIGGVGLDLSGEEIKAIHDASAWAVNDGQII